MDDRDHCRGCGRPRPADAPGGLCPVCLFRAGMAEAASEADPDEPDDADLPNGRPATARRATLPDPPGGWPRCDLAGTEIEPGFDPSVRDDWAAWPVPPARPARRRAPAEGVGSRIGPYELSRQIGEGGMGKVYMAEQEQPVRRRVALKIIKPGMDSDQVIARFEAERQALAMMDHPNIARVFEAGQTDGGRPYFAMELVNGAPITEYCDGAQLSPRERLELFIPVCMALQHAHQKGIIHRDVKPSNVLVTVSDGEPVPKVIDFGIAKAIDRRTTERTTWTQLGAVVGTLEYMSPEQAEASGGDVDTRSDVYSLGVLLYELLTGGTPLGREDLRAAGYDEILRRIREEEPPAPSTRLGESGDAMPAIADRRRIEPARLARLVRGELDWIVMKALEKDRGRRYESAGGLARDVRRYLDDEPVEASPPSRRYRLGKFASRNRAALASAAVFAALLIAGTGVSVWQAVRARTAELKADARLAEVEAAGIKARAALDQSEQDRAQAQAVSKFLVDAFRRPDPSRDGRTLLVTELLDQAVANLDADAAGPPRIKAELFTSIAETYYGLGLYDQSAATHRRAIAVRRASLGADHLDTLASQIRLGLAYNQGNRYREAIDVFERTVARREQIQGADHPDTLRSRRHLAHALIRDGQTDRALAILEETAALWKKRHGPRHPDTLESMQFLAIAQNWAGKPGKYISALEEVYPLREALLGPDHPATLNTRLNLAGAYEVAGQLAKAIRTNADSIALHRRVHGADHPETLLHLDNMALACIDAKDPARAIEVLDEVLAIRRKKQGFGHPDTLRTMQILASAHALDGRIERALALHDAVVSICKGRRGADHPDTLTVMAQRVEFFAGRSPRAVALAEEALELRKARLGPDHMDTLGSRVMLAVCLQHAGQFGRALALYEANDALLKEKLGPDHRLTLVATAYHARLCRGFGRSARAVQLGEEVLAARAAKLGPENIETLRAMSELGLALAADGKLARAVELHGKVGVLLEELLGRDHPETIGALTNLAAALEAGHRDREAEPLRRDALQRQRARWRPGCRELVDYLVPLGLNLLRQGLSAQAEPLFRECLAIDTAQPRGDGRASRDRDLLCDSLIGQGRHAEAEPMAVAAYKELAHRDGGGAGGSPGASEAGRRVVELYDAWGKPEQAAAWRARLGLAELPADVFAGPG